MPPGGIRRWTCLVIFGLISTTEQSVGGGTTPSRNDSTQQFPVYLSPEVDSKTVKVGQSFGIQGVSDNSRGAASNRSQAVIAAASPQRNVVAPSSSHYGSQPNSFVPSHFMGFKKPNQEQNSVPPPPTTNAQRRVDFHVADDDSEAYNEDDIYEPERDGYYHGRHEIEHHSNSGIRYEDDHQYLEEPKTREEQPPETRQSLGFPVSGPGFIGPAPFDPLPPPPTSIKGSVDYILIPLVLIGIAGPIFVVLYVILGAFEAKISPISRSLKMDGLDAYKVMSQQDFSRRELFEC